MQKSWTIFKYILLCLLITIAQGIISFLSINSNSKYDNSITSAPTIYLYQTEKNPATIIISIEEPVKVQDYLRAKIYYLDSDGNIIDGTCYVELYKDDSLIDSETINSYVCVNGDCYYPYTYYIERSGEYKLYAECSSINYETANESVTFYPEKLSVSAYSEHDFSAYTLEGIPIKIYYPSDGQCQVDTYFNGVTETYYAVWTETGEGPYGGYFEVSLGPYYDSGTLSVTIKCFSEVYQDYIENFNIEIHKREMYSDLKNEYSFYYEELPQTIRFLVYDSITNDIIYPDCNVPLKRACINCPDTYEIEIPKRDVGTIYYDIVCSKEGYEDYVKTIRIDIVNQPTTLRIVTDKAIYYTYETLRAKLEYFSTKGTPLNDATCTVEINGNSYSVKPFEWFSYYIGPSDKVIIKASCYSKNYQEKYTVEHIYVKIPKLSVSLSIPSEVKVNQPLYINPIIKDELGRSPINVKCKIEYLTRNFFGKIIDRGETEFAGETTFRFSKAGKTHIKISCCGEGYKEGTFEKDVEVVVIAKKEFPIVLGFSISGLIILIIFLKFILKK